MSKVLLLLHLVSSTLLHLRSPKFLPLARLSSPRTNTMGPSFLSWGSLFRFSGFFLGLLGLQKLAPRFSPTSLLCKRKRDDREDSSAFHKIKLTMETSSNPHQVKHTPRLRKANGRGRFPITQYLAPTIMSQSTAFYDVPTLEVGSTSASEPCRNSPRLNTTLESSSTARSSPEGVKHDSVGTRGCLQPTFGIPSFPSLSKPSARATLGTCPVPTTHPQNVSNDSMGTRASAQPTFGTPSLPLPKALRPSTTTASLSAAERRSDNIKSNTTSNTAYSRPTVSIRTWAHSDGPKSSTSLPKQAASDSRHIPHQQKKLCIRLVHTLSCDHVVRTKAIESCGANCVSPTTNEVFICQECSIRYADALQLSMEESARLRMNAAEKTDDNDLFQKMFMEFVDVRVLAKRARMSNMAKMMQSGRVTMPEIDETTARTGKYGPEFYAMMAYMYSSEDRESEAGPSVLPTKPGTENGTSTQAASSPIGTSKPADSSINRPNDAPPHDRTRRPTPPVILGKRTLVENPESQLQGPPSKLQKEKMVYIPDEADMNKRGTKHARESGSENPFAEEERPSKRRSISPPAVFHGSLASRTRGLGSEETDDKEDEPLRMNACKHFTHDPMSVLTQDKNVVRESKRRAFVEVSDEADEGLEPEPSFKRMRR